jgi:hypothetical protein
MSVDGSLYVIKLTTNLPGLPYGYRGCVNQEGI